MRKSLLIGFATLFVIVAASCFGYIGWQLWGTSYLSNKTQTETLNEITNQWNIPTEDNGDDTIEMATSEENEEPLLKNKNVKKFLKTVENDEKDDAVVNIDGETFRGIALLSVPQAGIRNLPVLKGSQDRILDKGVGGYYEGTARPGQLGNFAVAGHRVSYSGVFDHLDKLKPGDKIKVQTKKHTYFYKIFLKKVVKPNNAQPLQPVPFGDGTLPTTSYITLTTCTPRFSTEERLIVSGKLTNVT